MHLDLLSIVFVGQDKREAHKNWSMVTGTTLRTTVALCRRTLGSSAPECVSVCSSPIRSGLNHIIPIVVCLCVCVCVWCVYSKKNQSIVKLQITAQSGPVILVILYHSH